VCGSFEEEEAPPPAPPPPPPPAPAIGIHVDVIVLSDPPRPSPAVVQVFGAAGPGEARGKRVGEPVLAPGGQVDVPLDPGRYTVVVSRGPEFTLGEETVEVRDGALTPVVLGVRRVVDTRRYVPCDLHGFRTGEDGPDLDPAAAASAGAAANAIDARLSEAERVAANVALGSDCAVLTNGPFVTLSADKIPQGGLVPLGSRPVELHLHVDRAPWVDASEVALWVGGVRSEPIPLPVDRPGWTGSIVTDIPIRLVRSLLPAKPGSPVKFLLSHSAIGWTLNLAEDTFVVAAVSGRRPLEPGLSGDGEAPPFGMTAPVWIDADGDGRGIAHW
jgi:hypothetical protein